MQLFTRAFQAKRFYFIRNIRKKLVCCIRNRFSSHAPPNHFYFILCCIRILFPRVFGIRGKNNSFVRFGDLKTVVITVGRPSCCLCMIVNECRTFFFFFRRVISKDTLIIMYYFLYILTIVVVFCLACPVFREIHCLFPRKLMAHWVHGDDTPMMSWCRAQILTDTSTANFYGKLTRTPLRLD